MGSSSSVARKQRRGQHAITVARKGAAESESPGIMDTGTHRQLQQELKSKEDEVKMLSRAIKSKEAENNELRQIMKRTDASDEQNNADAPPFTKIQADIAKYEKALQSKDMMIAELQMKILNLKMQKDKQIGVLKETIEKVINEKDFKLRRLEALWGDVDQRQGIIPNYNEQSQGAGRFGISAESTRPNSTKMQGESPKSDFELSNIRRAFRKNIFLSNLGKSQIDELTSCMEKVKMKAGDVIIKEGESGSDLFVIETGEVNVVKGQGDQFLACLPPGCVFGELAVLYNCKRTASVHAKSDVLLWSLSRLNFQSIVQRFGEKIRKDYIDLLKQVPQFNELSDEKIMRICDCLVKETFDAGQYIIRQGEVGDTFYIVSDGQVKITKNMEKIEAEGSGAVDQLCIESPMGFSRPIAVILHMGHEEFFHGSVIRIMSCLAGQEFISYVERGGFFGERALLSDERRAANVIAFTDVICLTMDRQAFNSLIGHISMTETASESQDRSRETKDSSLDGVREKSSQDDDVPNSDRDVIHTTTLQDIETLMLLGKGGFGSVSLVSIKRLGDRPLAMKKIKKAFIMKTGQERHVREERMLLSSMLSPFICRLYRTYKDQYYVYMLMDAYLGGDVFTYMKMRGPFDDEGAKFAIGCVVEALGYLHSKVIAYRDLKPENLMIDQSGYVKLIDFGFAKKMKKGNKTWTFCGTPEYFPPEILQNSGHDYSADYWSLGILTFELLTGTTPFFSTDEMTVYENIIDGIERVKFLAFVPKNAELFVRNLCKLDPQNRLGNSPRGFNEIRKHRWYRGFHWEGLRHQKLVSPINSNIANPTKMNSLGTTVSDEDMNDGDVPDSSSWDFDF